MSTSVLVIRHAQTLGNVEDLVCGHTETPLTALGIAQARALGRRLTAETIHHAVTSDLSRAADTAAHALAGRGVTIALDPRLREMHYGDWEALPGKDLIARQPETMKEFFRGRLSPPGGESIAGLRERTHAAFREAVNGQDGRTVALFSHGNAIGALLAELLAMPIELSWAFAFGNTSITRLHVSGSGRVTVLGVNDASHTLDLAEA